MKKVKFKPLTKKPKSKAQQKKSVPMQLRPVPQMSMAPTVMNSTMSSRFSMSMGSKPNAIRVSGCDFLSSVQTGGTATSGTLLYSLNVGVQNRGTRLYEMAALYEKYNVKRMRFHWVPAVGSSTNGTICMALDRDPADLVNASAGALLNQVLALSSSLTSAPWQPFSVDYRPEDPQQFYYTNSGSPPGDPRLVYIGTLMLVVLNTLPGNTVMGSIWVDYDLELFDPCLDNGSAESSCAQTTSAGTAVSNALGAALNGLAASGGLSYTGVSQLIQDALGNWGWLLKAGNSYGILTQFANLSGATSFAAPTVKAINTVTSTTGAAPAATVTPILSQAGTATADALKFDYVQVKNGDMGYFPNVGNAVNCNAGRTLISKVPGGNWLTSTSF